MVKKILKYDLMAYFRTLVPVYLITIGIAALNRLIQVFDSTSMAYDIVYVSSTIMSVVAMIVTLVMTFILVIVRFYKNLYSSEGYLSFALPVKESEHIWAKVLGGLIVTLIAAVADAISLVIILSGGWGASLWNNYGLKVLFECLINTYGVGNFVAYVILIALIVVVVIAADYLFIYNCLTVGQLANKNRVLLAFGVYFGVYVAEQILGTIFVIVVSYVNFGFIDALTRWNSAHQTLGLYFVYSFIILLEGLLGMLWFLITKYIMKNKLNVE